MLIADAIMAAAILVLQAAVLKLLAEVRLVLPVVLKSLPVVPATQLQPAVQKSLATILVQLPHAIVVAEARSVTAVC
jgi:hypothetical protein